MSQDDIDIEVEVDVVEFVTVELNLDPDIIDLELDVELSHDAVIVASGNVGPQGPQGEQGIPGEDGADGPQGPVGPEASFGFVEAKGDLIVGIADDFVDRFPVGSDGQIVKADSTKPLGLVWEDDTTVLNDLLDVDIPGPPSEPDDESVLSYDTGAGVWTSKPGVLKDHFDAKGDILVGLDLYQMERFPVGANGQVLEADSAETFGMKWNNIKKVLQLKIIDDSTVLTVGDGKLIFICDPSLDGLNLIDADMFVSTVSSSGLVTVQIRNVSVGVDILSTKITIDPGDFDSYNADTQPVIDTDNDGVVTGTRIAIDVDVAGTGAKGLGVVLTYGLI